MKRSSVLKKFDKEIENLWDVVYKIKDVLESTDDYELSELGGKFLDQIAEVMEEGEGEESMPAGEADISPGEEEHDTNPIDLVQNGEKIGELTG